MNGDPGTAFRAHNRYPWGTRRHGDIVFLLFVTIEVSDIDDGIGGRWGIGILTVVGTKHEFILNTRVSSICLCSEVLCSTIFRIIAGRLPIERALRGDWRERGRGRCIRFALRRGRHYVSINLRCCWWLSLELIRSINS
jgi:hypothetical protein